MPKSGGDFKIKCGDQWIDIVCDQTKVWNTPNKKKPCSLRFPAVIGCFFNLSPTREGKH
ncbi:hypothetical protein [Bacteroides vicugnae]|uniref:hypothetical protein n=1 Tax=Bacteroides vicugnae TaxID=3037989 RepID=UPI002ABE0D51|nr:hypothetical protein [Bacteroides sp. A2-P53]